MYIQKAMLWFNSRLKYQHLLWFYIIFITIIILWVFFSYRGEFGFTIAVLASAQGTLFLGATVGAIKNGADFIARLAHDEGKEQRLSGITRLILIFLFLFSLWLTYFIGPVGPVLVVYRIQEARDLRREYGGYLKDIEKHRNLEHKDQNELCRNDTLWCKSDTLPDTMDWMDDVTSVAKEYIKRVRTYESSSMASRLGIKILSDEATAIFRACGVLAALRRKCDHKPLYSACERINASLQWTDEQPTRSQALKSDESSEADDTVLEACRRGIREATMLFSAQKPTSAPQHALPTTENPSNGDAQNMDSGGEVNGARRDAPTQTTPADVDGTLPKRPTSATHKKGARKKGRQAQGVVR